MKEYPRPLFSRCSVADALFESKMMFLELRQFIETDDHQIHNETKKVIKTGN